MKIQLFLALWSVHVFAAEPVKVYVLDPNITKAEAQGAFSDSKYEIIEANQKPVASDCDPLFSKSGLITYTDRLDPYEKKMLSLRAQTLSLEKLQQLYPKLPAPGLKKLMELSRAK